MISHIVAYAVLIAHQTADLSSRLMGSWVGTLEYRDFSDNSREKLGTLLRVFKDKASGRLVFRYVYDDGPSKVVQDRDEVVIDTVAGSYSAYDSDGKSSDTYKFSALIAWDKDGKGTVILLGHGTENGSDVDIRQTLSVDAKALNVLRESRLPGKEFLFRHEYRFERVSKA
jgi:hypothetical protein